MANALGQAGATVEPSEFASLAMDEQFTGLWTQRNPLRDADVPYVMRKYYSASRFDSMIDGINREISARLTDVRRPGSSVYNSSRFPPIERFYSFRSFSQGQELIRVIADCQGEANQLLNPNFSQGATGWVFETDPGPSGGSWALWSGTLPTGSIGNLAMYTGIATSAGAAVSNQAHIGCTPGQVVAASGWGLGEVISGGTATLRITFFAAAGTVINTIYSPPVPNNNAWTQVSVSGAAPAGSAWAIVDFAIINKPLSAGHWWAWGFQGGYAPLLPTVRDVTGPTTNTIIRAKDPAAGRTTFLSVGNVLYGADGVDTWKWVSSSQSWLPNTLYQPGDYIVDPNGNIQQAMGAQTATIINVQVEAAGSGRKLTLFFDPLTPLNIPNNIRLILSGMTTVAAANGATPYDAMVVSSSQVSFVYSGTTLPTTPYAPETGTASTGTGISGSTPPTWNTNLGLVTQDGTLQWVNKGSALQSWGGPGPQNAPIVTQTAAPTVLPNWQANTWYAPQFQIIDTNGNLQQLVGPAPPIQIKTGNAMPTWATGPAGAITTEGGGGGSNAQWKLIGPANWIASHAYAVGDAIQVTYTYWITTTTYQWTVDSHGAFIQIPVQTQVAVQATSLFVCNTAGTSNAVQPAWVNGLGTVTTEAAPSTVKWTNKGTATSWPGANALLSLATKIVDRNNNLEEPTILGQSGATEPTWNPAGPGSFTADNTLSWKNDGIYAASGSGSWQWAYSGMNSITGEISNPSPPSAVFTPSTAMLPVIQGQGLPNPPWDMIILWRTATNGTILLYEDQFPNPGPTQQWVYTDTNLDDSALNAQRPAPGSTFVNTLTTPPPATATAPEYHCGRIFMINGNYVIYSGGSDTVTGNGNSAFPPLNYFELPEQAIRLKSITMQNGGLIVFCLANTYVILGDGTGNPPFQPPRIYMENVGLMGYDGLCMVGSTFHGISNKGKVFSFDPANGYLETGFPVGDQFKRVTTGGINAALYNPATAYVIWHEKDSGDTGLYVADGAMGWFRWSPIAPPESGSLWSPRAAIVGGTSAVQSIEVMPGVFDLLIGPASSGPIRKRDPLVTGDWVGTAYLGYPSWDVKGSIGLCETGEVAEIVHIALKSVAVGARPAVSLLLDELAGGVTVEGTTTVWEQISLDDGHHEDPPNLEPSITMFSDRYRASDTAENPKCENFQLKIDYGTQMVADELLKFAVYGGVYKERRQQ